MKKNKTPTVVGDGSRRGIISELVRPVNPSDKRRKDIATI